MYKLAAEKGLNLERKYYSEKNKNWPDFRFEFNNEAEEFFSAWCNGAPGIALGRACLWGTDLWDKKIEEEIENALLTTASTRIISDHLCCGTLGLVSIMRYMLKGPWSLSQEVTDTCQESINQLMETAVCKALDPDKYLYSADLVNGKTILPGMMNGHSGMAMALMNTTEYDDNIAYILSAGILASN